MADFIDIKHVTVHYLQRVKRRMSTSRSLTGKCLANIVVRGTLKIFLSDNMFVLCHLSRVVFNYYIKYFIFGNSTFIVNLMMTPWGRNM